MRIGIIAHNAHPICEPFQGGLEMLTYLLVKELVNRNHQVYTLCKQGSELKGNMVYYTDLDENWNSESSSAGLYEFGQFYSSITHFLKNDFDIIHNNSLSHHAIALGSVLNIPYLTSFHTPIFDNIHIAINAISESPNQTFTTVSDHLNMDYQHHLKDVLTVYNGIDLSKWKTSTTQENYFSWCGRICKEKGLLEIMDLCHDHNLKLKIAGPIANEIYYEEFISPRLEKYKNCEYLGHLNQEKVNQLYSQSKAFLFTSTWQEPYGLVIAEALAAGTPVIANNIGAASEILTDDCGILFDINDPETFIMAISKLSTIAPTNCRERAENFCSHHKMVDNYEEIYRQLVTKRNTTR